MASEHIEVVVNVAELLRQEIYTQLGKAEVEEASLDHSWMKLGVLLAVGALVVLGARLAGRTQGGGAASAPEIKMFQFASDSPNTRRLTASQRTTLVVSNCFKSSPASPGASPEPVQAVGPCQSCASTPEW